jgi:hypothetical protein
MLVHETPCTSLRAGKLPTLNKTLRLALKVHNGFQEDRATTAAGGKLDSARVGSKESGERRLGRVGVEEREWVADG